MLLILLRSMSRAPGVKAHPEDKSTEKNCETVSQPLASQDSYCAW